MQGDFLIYLDERAGVSPRLLRVAKWLVRIALAAAFASAVADRFGFWGPPGTPGVAWGSVAGFNAYVARLNWFLPPSCIGAVAWIATGSEISLAIALLVGWQLRWMSLASAVLLLLFGLTMTLALGLKPALDYSVFTAAAAAFLLSSTEPNKSGRPEKSPAREA
jgi:uncharacterized membrane protein YphA (DoxX/SURF4 family)